MGPLDLRAAPPRSPRAELAGVIFLPRSIDKARATLAGGDIGLYSIPGLTEMMLETFGISLPEFVEAVRSAATDDDVAAFVTGRAAPEAIERWNGFVRDRPAAGGDAAVARERYPWLPESGAVPPVLDVLEEDDRRSFVS
jgi:hypothetical protein